MDFWEKTNYTDGVPETYTKQLREKKMCDFWVYMPFKDIEQITAFFFFWLDQLSITWICVPSYDRSYNVYLFPYWFVIGYFSVTTRI